MKINVRNNNGRCLIRFRYAGSNYAITHGSYSDEHELSQMKLIAKQIEYDINFRCFDATLAKYKPWEAEKLTAMLKEAEKTLKPSLESFEMFVAAKQLHIQYSSWKMYRALLMRLKLMPELKFPADEKMLSTWLMRQEVASSTKRNYQTMFTAYGKWLEDKGGTDPYSKVEYLSRVMKPVQTYSEDELRKILEWFKEKQPWYYQFVRFRLLTGTRTAEAIGLEWGKLDYEKQEILIDSTITRFEKGEKKKKGTKNGTVRTIPMNEDVKKCLLAQASMINDFFPITQESLVFPNKRGGSIDTSKFSECYWVPCLASLGIKQKRFYNLRHTFISFALEQGMAPPEIAKLCDHDLGTLYRHYAGVIKKPVLPKLPN